MLKIWFCVAVDMMDDVSCDELCTEGDKVMGRTASACALCMYSSNSYKKSIIDSSELAPVLWNKRMCINILKYLSSVAEYKIDC